MTNPNDQVTGSVPVDAGVRDLTAEISMPPERLRTYGDSPDEQKVYENGKADPDAKLLQRAT